MNKNYHHSFLGNANFHYWGFHYSCGTEYVAQKYNLLFLLIHKKLQHHYHDVDIYVFYLCCDALAK